MKNAWFTFMTVAVLVLWMPWLSEAHHGWAEFDSTAEVTLKGTVADFHFVNPHCVVELDVKDEKGQVRKWQGEFSNPGQLARKGWTAASLQAGEKITITGHLARNGSPAMHVMRMLLPNGQEVKVDSAR